MKDYQVFVGFGNDCDGCYVRDEELASLRSQLEEARGLLREAWDVGRSEAAQGEGGGK